MRVRVTLLLAALAVIAIAGLRQVDRRSTEPDRSSHAPSGHLAGRPAPVREVPAIGSAATTATTTGQTTPHAQWHRHLCGDQNGVAISAQDVSWAGSASRPRSFPLLI